MKFKVEKIEKLKPCKAPRCKIKLDQFSKVLLAYFAVLSGIAGVLSIAKDIYFIFVDPMYMDWGSTLMYFASIMTGGVLGYMIKSALEKRFTGKDTDAEGMGEFLNNDEGTYNVPEIV